MQVREASAEKEKENVGDAVKRRALQCDREAVGIGAGIRLSTNRTANTEHRVQWKH